MSPPSALEYCPPEIRQDPRPHDECSPPWEPEKAPPALPEHRLRYLSLGAELNMPFSSNVDFTWRPGVVALFRPWSHFHLGVQADTDFGEQLTAHGRFQGSFWLNRYGIWRLNVAGLVGLRHLFEQSRPLEDGGRATLSGTLFSAGLELGMEWQVASQFSFSPFLRSSLSPATELNRVDEPDGHAKTAAQYEFLLGTRLTFDLISHD